MDEPKEQSVQGRLRAKFTQSQSRSMSIAKFIPLAMIFFVIVCLVFYMRSVENKLPKTDDNNPKLPPKVRIPVQESDVKRRVFGDYIDKFKDKKIDVSDRSFVYVLGIFDSVYEESTVQEMSLKHLDELKKRYF
ncbi:MAG: hypothetical protein HY606_10250, partial [Planctomycetes bacterium]|nr:hypothetical protein [Planctomycetota bacterium]